MENGCCLVATRRAAEAWSASRRPEETIERVKEARSGTPHEKVRGKLEESLAAHRMAGETYRKALEMYKTSGFDPFAADGMARGVDGKVVDLLGAASGEAQDIGAQATSAAVKSADRAYYFAIGGTVGTMLLALVGLYFFIRRAVLSPITAAVRFSERLAEGDLTADIRSSAKDETGHLLRMLGKMKDSLGAVVAQVRSSAEAVVTASSQVSAGTTDLSQRTEEQASSLEETAASMEELASTVKQNADNARQAERARAQRLQARRAGRSGSRARVSTMTEIAQREEDHRHRLGDRLDRVPNHISRSTPRSRPRARASRAAASRWWPPRCARSRQERPGGQGDQGPHRQLGAEGGERHRARGAGATPPGAVIDVKRVSDLMASIAEASSDRAAGAAGQQDRDRDGQGGAADASALQQSAAAAGACASRRVAGARGRSFRIGAGEGRTDAPLFAGRGGERPALAPLAVARRCRCGQAAQPVTAAAGDDWEEL